MTKLTDKQINIMQRMVRSKTITKQAFKSIRGQMMRMETDAERQEYLEKIINKKVKAS